MVPPYLALLKLTFNRDRSIRVYLDSIETVLWTPASTEQVLELNYFDDEDLNRTIEKLKSSADIKTIEVVSIKKVLD